MRLSATGEFYERIEKAPLAATWLTSADSGVCSGADYEIIGNNRKWN